MINSLSLRARLTFVILIPLLLIAVTIGGWAYRDAQMNAAERFDRSLLLTALAVSRDTASTGGNALSPDTRDLLRDTSGGQVFYHVYAPDGVFVTGYATPPVPPNGANSETGQVYYDAIYQGANVRALRSVQAMSIDNVTGPFTFTVWQGTAVRDGFVQSRTQPLFLIIAAMIGALAVIVWFGVRLGLYPLLDLEDAIARRSSSDLSPIKRRIPPEVNGIVTQFNGLLTELSRTFEAKNVFISNAAHQLRNPIAGVMSLAQSVQSAKSLEDAKSRSNDLMDAARDAGALANDLLTLERAQATALQDSLFEFDAVPILHQIAAKFHTVATDAGLAFQETIPSTSVALVGDPVMFEQAILNLLNNAMLHGGASLSQLGLRAHANEAELIVTIADDGIGIAPNDYDKALGRFSQIVPSSGSGLGLPIAETIVESYGGSINLSRADDLFEVSLSFPRI